MNFRQILKKYFPGKKYLSGEDTFLRHRCMASLLNAFQPEFVLDVGGENHLKNFTKDVKILSANPKNLGVRCSGHQLPFKNRAFDVIVSIDTLEHMPKELRREFCLELLRVARKGVILCAPLGTPEHIEYEKQLLSSGSLWGDFLYYTAEHVKHGLPDPEEIKALCDSFSGRIYYQGDFRRVRQVEKSMAYLWLAWNAMGNFIKDLFWMKRCFLKKEFYSHANRFYIVLKTT